MVVIMMVVNLPLGTLLVTYTTTVTKYWTISNLGEKFYVGSQFESMINTVKLIIWFPLVLSSPILWHCGLYHIWLLSWYSSTWLLRHSSESRRSTCVASPRSKIQDSLLQCMLHFHSLMCITPTPTQELHLGNLTPLHIPWPILWEPWHKFPLSVTLALCMNGKPTHDKFCFQLQLRYNLYALNHSFSSLCMPS